MSLFACGRRHYVVGLSARPSVRPYINKYLFRIRSGVGVKANLIFVCQGGRRVVKTNLNKKVGGPGKLLFFSVASSGLFFFW